MVVVVGSSSLLFAAFPDHAHAAAAAAAAPSLGGVLSMAAGKAFKGGVAGFAAGVLQVC